MNLGHPWHPIRPLGHKATAPNSFQLKLKDLVRCRHRQFWNCEQRAMLVIPGGWLALVVPFLVLLWLSCKWANDFMSYMTWCDCQFTWIHMNVPHYAWADSLPTFIWVVFWPESSEGLKIWGPKISTRKLKKKNIHPEDRMHVDRQISHGKLDD